MTKTKYVVGFAFDSKLDKVLLIRKKRPSWQIGYLNGIGGHINPKELPEEAMVREFEEECGIKTKKFMWSRLAVISGKDWIVYFFYTVDNIDRAKTTTDEEVVICNVDTFAAVISNLRWLIPLAKYKMCNKAETISVRQSSDKGR